MAILNAYYVDPEMQEKLYGSITPVNSFRLILNQYFDTSYLLLDDISYSAYKMNQLGAARVIENTCTPAVR